ncbi:MAG: ABC transporter ATP-binding protein [Anaerolineaceae bacterium]|nr:ABC transporter ATP-binding protein [Anaerolineaceae bacterium]
MSLHFEDEDFDRQKSLDSKIFQRIVEVVRPHWKWVVGFLAAILLVSGLDAFFTYLNKRILDEAILPKDIHALTSFLVLYGLLILVQAAGVYAFIYLVGILGELIRYDLRRNLFNHLQELSLAYYSRTPVGWIIARVTSDTERLADLTTWGLLDSSWAMTNILTSIAFMLFINWKLALVVLALLPVLLWVAIQFRKRILAEFRRVRRFNSQITRAYNENITGVRVVKALGREKENMREFSSLTSEMYQAGFKAAWLSALFLPTVQILSALAVGMIVWYSGAQRQAGGMTVGGIYAFVTYITFMMWPIQDLARVFAEMQHAVASAERIFNLIDLEPDVKDLPGAIHPASIQGDIIFENVSFGYDNDPPVLGDFNLHVQRGETIALVGPTGGGKSTIVNLLCRFYEPRHGTIRIGDHDYRDLSLKAIQSRIGMVPQTPYLFSGSVRENIRYGRLDASDEEIVEAARLAGAHDFILQLEKAYEEPVGEGGGLLSVGQKQLISLARAILAKPEIFIMDEATSSVDTLTESYIQKGMELLLKQCTSFVIAHRLSTIRRAHRILVIEDGKIAEIGTHQNLIHLQGKYYQLYTRQFRYQMEQALDPFKDSLKA